MNIAEAKTQIKGVQVGAGTYVVTFTEGCTFTNKQRADIQASKIISKWATQIPEYLDLCAELRADNPDMGDATIRAMARGSFQTGF